MPVDKWGIPFFYQTKKTAGVTNSGSGFFWQQNNNILKDSDAGMVHLGKELRNGDVHVINTTTGEWEFGFVASDGLSLSGPTGHHSGGEQHGCEGFTYMIDVDVRKTPATFRFRKETYHVNYDDDPVSREWTHPKVNYKIIGSGWNGYAWVRYNKKGGTQAAVVDPDTGLTTVKAKDSVICETWWNSDPENDPSAWTMLKRIEDKGGKGWGDGGKSCDGADESAVGTWSNIQFRFKMDASDFSLHPIKPEGEDDSYVHSIGGADMSFKDSESRGYGYAANMPRDIEMKCLFKFDADNGKCRFKNISLREIDPTISFTDDPTTPPPPTGGDPTPTLTEVQGLFDFRWDVNTIGAGACAGTGAGGGGGSGNSIFYSVPIDTDIEISDVTPPFAKRTRVVMSTSTSSSVFYNKIIKQVDIPLKKTGTPGASPTVHCKIWNGSTVIYDSPTTFDPSTFTTSFVTKTFDFAANTHSMVTGDRIGVEYTGTSASNFIVASYVAMPTSNTTYYQYENGSYNLKERSLSMDVWD